MSRTTLWTATVLISVTLSVFVAEAMLRLSGRTPWIPATFGSREPTVIVLYGFIAHHAARSVAPVSWLKVLSKFSRRGTVHVPYATLDEDGALVRHPPVAYLRLPFRGSSATIALVDKVYMRTRVRTRKEKNAWKVLERTVIRMGM